MCQIHNKQRPCLECRAALDENVGRMAEAARKVVPFECKTHGTPFEKILDMGMGKIIGLCSLCQKERAAKEEEEHRQMAEREARKKQERLNSTLTNSMITPRFMERSFDNFVAKSEEQKKVLKTCHWFLENWQKCVGLIFIGNRGTGKNHLASALVKEFVLNKEKTALMTEAIKVIRAIKESWRKEGATEGEVLSRFVEPDLLVIDEIGVQFGTETEKMFLTEIINDRYNWMRPTILLGNMSIDEIEKAIGERAVDRFKEGGGVCQFTWDSYRGKALTT